MYSIKEIEKTENYQSTIESLLNEISTKNWYVERMKSNLLIIRAPDQRLLKNSAMSEEDINELQNILNRIVNKFGYVIPYSDEIRDDLINFLTNKNNQ